MKIITTPIAASVHAEHSNPIFGETSTIVSMEDEAAGPYIVLRQNPDDGEQVMRFDIEELEAVLEAARSLIAAYPVEAKP